MRNAVQFRGVVPCPAGWRDRLLTALEHKIHPEALARCGATASLLAYCSITLEQLVESKQQYALEHLISALKLTFDDLRLLGFRIDMLAKPQHYPLIVLYDMCAFRADTLFAFDLGFADLQRYVIHADSRYATLLDLNVSWWRKALER